MVLGSWRERGLEVSTVKPQGGGFAGQLKGKGGRVG